MEYADVGSFQVGEDVDQEALFDDGVVGCQGACCQRPPEPGASPRSSSRTLRDHRGGQVEELLVL
jgi:hypothetical protein